jgi:branched-chain amino acid transport system substrate-binding protein
MKTLFATLGALAALVLLAPTRLGAAGEPWRIGYLHSFSGYLANMGTASRDGFLLGVDEINKRGGVDGRPFKVFSQNDESDPSKGVPAAIQLINADRVLAIVGPARSDITEPLGPIAARAGVVDMTCSFILPTQGDYTFATVPAPEEEARVAVGFLAGKGARSIGILHAIDLYDKISAKAFTDEAGRHGIKVLATESYNAAADKNFIPQLTKIKAAAPDWLTVLGSGAPVPLIINQKTEIGFGAAVLGNLAFAAAGIGPLLRIAGPNLQGAYMMTLPVAVWETLPRQDPRLPRIVRYREAFKAKYGRDPVMADWWTAQNYDIAFLLAEGLRRAGPNAGGAALRTALEGLRNFEGVVGTFSFGPGQHAGNRGVVVARVEGDRIVLVK